MDFNFMNYFSEIIGNETQISELMRDISMDNVSHAYLFSGPGGIGKGLIARAFSKALITKNSKDEEAKIVSQIEKGTCPDFTDMAVEESLIKVEVVRDLIEKLSMSPSGNVKVFLMENVERMNIASANALLKILEEPPKNTVILMTCLSSTLIPETVLSRARHIKLFPPKKERSVEFLCEKFPKEKRETVEDFFDLSLERIGKTFLILSNESVRAEYEEMRKELSSLIKEGLICDRFAFVEKIVSDKKYAKQNIALMFEVLTYLMRQKMIFGDTKEKELALKILSKIPGDGILLKRNINAKLVLENLMLLI